KFVNNCIEFPIATGPFRPGAPCVPTTGVGRKCPPSAPPPATSNAVAASFTPTRGSFVTPAVFAVGCCACAITTDKQTDTISQHTLLPAFTSMLLFVINFQTRLHRARPGQCRALCHAATDAQGFLWRFVLKAQ